MKTMFLYVIAAITLIMAPLQAKDLIFDLDGVLIKTGTGSVVREFGVYNVANYFFHAKAKNKKVGILLKEKFFAVLDDVSRLQMPNAMQSYAIAFDEYGQRLPYFMCAWMDGSMTGEEIIAMVMASITEHSEWFDHPSEEILIRRLTRMLFSPERFVKTRKISRAGIHFIKAQKRAGHRIYVLSNWDHNSFALLVKENPKLFGLFDGIVISGDIGVLKPYKEAYKTVLSIHQLQAEECIVFDDQIENLETAKNLTMHTIQVRKKGLRHNPNFRLVARDLRHVRTH